MDTILWVSGIGVSFIAGAVGSYILREQWMQRRYNQLSEYCETLQDELAETKQILQGKKGYAAKEANAEEDQAILMEAMALIQSGKAIPEVLKEVGMKHPQAAMRMAKKFGIG